MFTIHAVYGLLLCYRRHIVSAHARARRRLVPVPMIKGPAEKGRRLIACTVGKTSLAINHCLVTLHG
jgi:hypothetical protein